MYAQKSVQELTSLTFTLIPIYIYIFKQMFRGYISKKSTKLTTVLTRLTVLGQIWDQKLT